MTEPLIDQAVEQFSDWRWRLNNLYRITDKEGRDVQFKMNWAQERLFDNMHYLNVVLKARQLGFSTFIQIFGLDQCLFNSNLAFGTIAHTREDAEEMFRTKAKYPYEKLPDQLREAVGAVQDSARQLLFTNGSSLKVGTSLRGGTYQILHVSEYGKICARYPEKAREVKTGAFNTVQAGQVMFVESTAEGSEGDFHDICEQAQRLQRTEAKLTPLDFKFHFYPWWEEPGYTLEGDVVFSEGNDTYFAEIESQGVALTTEQKNWYAKKASQQGDDMNREYPSTPEEAFKAAVEGAYYAKAFVTIDSDKRVCDLPLEPGLQVHTWWDLGMNDLMSIWFVQGVGPWLHCIKYYQSSGEGLAHYAGKLQEFQQETGCIYGKHYWPHDGNVRILDEKGRKRTEVMRDLGYKVTIVPRGEINDGIEAVRNLLPKCRFDTKRTADGVKALRGYRKAWDETNSTWRNSPLHNEASNGADAFRTGAMGEDILAVIATRPKPPPRSKNWMG